MNQHGAKINQYNIICRSCSLHCFNMKCHKITIKSHENFLLISDAIKPATSRKPEPPASCTSLFIDCLLRQDDWKEDTGAELCVCVCVCRCMNMTDRLMLRCDSCWEFLKQVCIRRRACFWVWDA